MTADIALVLGILAVAVTFFLGGWLRLDIVAAGVLTTLAVTGLVTPQQALAGFSNPAVVTVAGMFVISASLARTGVANMIGRRMMSFAGGDETKLVIVIMGSAGVLSGFMNNAGVTAMLLPVVMDLARRTKVSPSRLLMPLALGAMLGGLTTLIGTPANLVASDILRDANRTPFGVFEFAPLGITLLAAGTIFVAFVGRRLLPETAQRRDRGPDELIESFALQERLFVIRLPQGSLLDGVTLADSRLGSALGLNVVAVLRPGRPELAPSAGLVLRSGDRLLVQGRPDLLRELRDRRRHLVREDESESIERLVDAEVGLAEVVVADGSSLAGRDLTESKLRERFGAIALSLMRDGVVHRTALHTVPLQTSDRLLLQGRRSGLEQLEQSSDFVEVRSLTPEEVRARYHLDERFLKLRVTERSLLVGRTIAESRLGDAAGLTVLGIVRDGAMRLLPEPTERFQPNDTLLVKAKPADLMVLRGLQRLEIEREDVPSLSEFESDMTGLLEVVLSPRTGIVGRTPRQAHIRERFGVTVLAIWREGRAYRHNLRDMTLRFGDALLLFGRRDRLREIGTDPNFVALTEAVREPPRSERAPLAVGILVAALLPVIAGWLPIAITVIAAALALVLTRCLTADEAYDAIELPALVLIAGMLPLGVALADTGAAALIARGVIDVTDVLGPRGVLLGLALMTALGAQVMPAPALVVLMAPIALGAAAELALSERALMMAVALSATSLASPVSHAANALIMGPGGYRYADYARVGLPITIILLAVVVGVLPIFFPL
jgi:di/tricarboxylate transporter